MSTAEIKFQRADRMYRFAIKIFIGFVLIMLLVIAYQVAHLQGDFSTAQNTELQRQEQQRKDATARLEKALAETQKQQVVTQQYIRCIGSVLLKPQAERTTDDFDACGIPGVTSPNELGQPAMNQSATVAPKPTASTTPSTVAPASPSTTNPTASQPVAAGSPPDDRSALGKLPVIGGLLNAIGL